MIFQTYHGDEIAFDDNNNEHVEEDDVISTTNYPIDIDLLQDKGI